MTANPTPMTTDRAIVLFISSIAPSGAFCVASADNASGISEPNNSSAATTNSAIMQKMAAITVALPLAPRAIADASAATSPTVTNGNDANVIATVPNSHSGDLNDVGYHRKAMSNPAMTASINPTLPNARHAVCG